jgi:hypothetical protein
MELRAAAVRRTTMTAEQKAWIDGADYEALLGRWRYAPAGDAMFQGDTGQYYKEAMAARLAAGADHVGASKRLG